MITTTRNAEENYRRRIDLLAALYTKVIKYHDLGDYDALEKSNASLLQSLDVPREKVEQVSKIVSLMYRTSDEADVQLGVGDRSKHDALFARIFELAGDLDFLLGVNHGSVRDEVRWWYHYRLSRSKVKDKKPNQLSSLLHFVATLLFLYMEHLWRIGAPIKAMSCAYWLAKAGKKHESGNWLEVELMLKHYWSAKIHGNSGKIEPKLVLV